MCISIQVSQIKGNFPFTKGEGKRQKLSFPSTVNNFRAMFDPHDTHLLRHMTQRMS